MRGCERPSDRERPCLIGSIPKGRGRHPQYETRSQTKGHNVTTPNPFAAPVQQQAPAPNPFGPGVAQQAEPAPAAPQQQYAAPAPAPQQQYGAPQGYAPAPQQYAPAPQQAAPVQQYAPPAAPAAYAGPPLDTSTLAAAGTPPPSGSGSGAKLADMYDRLVLVFPHTVETVARTERYITPEQRAKGYLTEERVTATVVVLDMGPGSSPAGAFIDFGGAPYEIPPKPHTTREALPYVRKAMWIAQSKVVAQLKPFLPASTGGTQGMVAGRVVKQGSDRNSPWYLAGADENELALCRQYMAGVAAGHFPHPLA